MGKIKVARGLKKTVKKIIHNSLRTDIPAGQASIGPPLGPMLGQRNINANAFCKDFNNKTSQYLEGVPLPTRASVNPDRSYNLSIWSPTYTFFLFQAAGIDRGAMHYEKETAGWITLKHVYEIAKIKHQDPNMELYTLKEVCEEVIRRAHTCGIEVKRDYDPEEYAKFLEERKTVVEEQLQELLEAKERKLLKK